MDNGQIHFGWWLKRKRVAAGFRSVRELAVKAGVAERTVMRLHKMPEPRSYDGTLQAVAVALGMTEDEFERQWRTTPVRQPKAKSKSEFVNVKIPRPLAESALAAAKAAGVLLPDWFADAIRAALLSQPNLRRGVTLPPEPERAKSADSAAKGSARIGHFRGEQAPKLPEPQTTAAQAKGSGKPK